MTGQNDEAEYRQLLREDPSHEAAAALGDFLRRQQRHEEALVVLMRALSRAPDFDRARLVLARVMYESGMVSFAVRELEHLLRRHPEKQFLRSLVERISPGSVGARLDGGAPNSGALDPTVEQKARGPEGDGEEKTFAEAEIDVENL